HAGDAARGVRVPASASGADARGHPVRPFGEPLSLHRLHEDRRCRRGVGRRGSVPRTGGTMTTSALPDVGSRAGTETDLRVVGRPIVHGEFREKVAGVLAYADDWHLPDMLYGRIVRAPVPCARIVSIDASAAEAL